jgi:hypothetical protein
MKAMRLPRHCWGEPLLEVRHKALERLTYHVSGLVTGKADNIVAIPNRRRAK